ncbi:MAG: MBL fold metallo-hydrolase [Candidatus Korarchaeota archaeon]|nr:MBL fold metallo-hydrolase [Thermoproteota archaeon]MCR8501594.1 MBL fold metallo-hydrolase [Thermoproteota archaeon]
MLEVTIYGGVNEIGGNKILISDGESSIFLDFGIPFERMFNYFGFPRPRPESVKQLISLGIIPNIPNLYSVGIEMDNKFDLDPEPEVDGIFISHAHLDHIGYISLISRKVKIYMGACSKCILDARMLTTWGEEFTSNYNGLDINTFRTGDKIRIGNFEVEPMHVDHSIPGAYGFIVRTGEGTVVYTGDLRWHGHAELTDDFVRSVVKEGDVDLLIVESTHIDYSGFTSEDEVRMKLKDIMQRFRGNVLVDTSKADYDRLYSISSATKETDRILLMDLAGWIYLKSISKCPGLRKELKFADVYVYSPKTRFSRQEKAILQDIDRELPENILVPETLEHSFREYNKDIKYKRLGEFLKRYEAENIYSTIMSPGRDIEKILRLVKHGDIFILASSEPISEESEIEFERLMNWFEELGIPIYHIHASGHITPLDLKRLIESINPKRIVPIHGKRPRLLQNFIGREKYRWILPEKGHSIHIEI